MRVLEMTYDELKAGFASPPVDFGVIYMWVWNGEMGEAAIDRQLDQMKSNGVGSVMIWAYYGLKVEYLSDTWFKRVQHAVSRAREIGMGVWIFDEGSYPSGSSAGKVVRNRPDVEAQSLALERIPVGGDVGVVQLMPERLVAVLGARRGAGTDKNALVAEQITDLTALVRPAHEPGGGWLDWHAPAGSWELLVITSQPRSVPFRYVHRGYKKDTSLPHPDHLKREATEEFIRTTHEAYRPYIGEEFGRTVKGFFADEPAVPQPVWADDFLEAFRERKGYDLRPHLASLFFLSVSDNAEAIRHDYHDVWSQLYEERFFRPLGDWCRANRMRFTMHMGGEDVPGYLAREASGDYFRINRPVDIPGVDAIWRQIWPGVEQNLEKLASSAAHGWGKARAISELYAIYGHGLSPEQAKWIVDHHLVRGINMFLAMAFPSSTESYRKYFHPPNLCPENVQWDFFGHHNRYAHRMSYLMALGRPVVHIAVYYPTSSLWMGDDESGSSANAIGSAMLASQRDFDFLAEDVLLRSCSITNGKISVPGGCNYTTVILPRCRAISPEVLRRLTEFKESGGSVISFGAPVSGGGLRSEPPEQSFSKLLAGERAHLLSGSPESIGSLDELLPRPDAALSPPGRGIRCSHRRFQDTELFFFHNEGDDDYMGEVSLKGTGNPETWDALTGTITPRWTWRREQNRTIVPLRLHGWESRVIVLAPGEERPHLERASFGEPIDVRRAGEGLRAECLVEAEGTHRVVGLDGAEVYTWEGHLGPAIRQMNLEREWVLVRADGHARAIGELADWGDWGWTGYSGSVSYQTSFDLPSLGRATVPPEWLGTHVAIDLGTVRYSAKVWVNGQLAGSRAWRPYRFEIGQYVMSGLNNLVVDVTNTDANGVFGDPRRLEALKASGMLDGSYFSVYAGFDVEQLPSGLLGPVTITARQRVAIQLLP